jgi:hypothetical protein
MAKTSIYLPDDLAEQVRAHGIPVSEVAQAALRQAVKDAEIKENVMTDIQVVADRLNARRAAEGGYDARMTAKARAYGAKWARTVADAAELEYLAMYDGSPDDFDTPVSLITFVSKETASEHRAAGGHGLPLPGSGVPLDPDSGYWAYLQAGAREVWDAVRPLLIELGDRGETLPPGSGGYSETVNPAYRLWLEREPAAEAPLAEHDRWKAEEPDEFL